MVSPSVKKQAVRGLIETRAVVEFFATDKFLFVAPYYLISNSVIPPASCVDSVTFTLL